MMWGEQTRSYPRVHVRAGGSANCTAPLDTSLAISQKIKIQLVEPKDAQSYHKDMCSTTFIAALFVVART